MKFCISNQRAEGNGQFSNRLPVTATSAQIVQQPEPSGTDRSSQSPAAPGETAKAQRHQEKQRKPSSTRRSSQSPAAPGETARAQRHQEKQREPSGTRRNSESPAAPGEAARAQRHQEKQQSAAKRPRHQQQSDRGKDRTASGGTIRSSPR
eukprot:sb/3473513/